MNPPNNTLATLLLPECRHGGSEHNGRRIKVLLFKCSNLRNNIWNHAILSYWVAKLASKQASLTRKLLPSTIDELQSKLRICAAFNTMYMARNTSDLQSFLKRRIGRNPPPSASTGYFKLKSSTKIIV